MYADLMVIPMREDLTKVGIRELLTPEEVDQALGKEKGTTLLVINSVCGCAAGNARPGVRQALTHQKRPDQLTTVFAGQDKEATARARSYIPDFPPSSPSFALFKDGRVVHFVPRHQIEGRTPEQIAAELISAFERYC
jgi:putative YphP/YqiW family bacilliredoxin